MVNREAERNRLVELLQIKSCWYNDCETGCDKCGNVGISDADIEKIADTILDDGWMRPPYEVGAKLYAAIGSLSLPIPYAVYEVTIQRYVLVKGGLVPVVKLKKGAVTYGEIHTSLDRLYATREEAEKALEGSGEK